MKRYKFENGKRLKAIAFDYYGKPTGWLDVTQSRKGQQVNDTRKGCYLAIYFNLIFN